MKTKQKSSLDAVKRIVLIAAVTMLLIVTAVVLLNDLGFFSHKSSKIKNGRTCAHKTKMSAKRPSQKPLVLFTDRMVTNCPI